MNSSRNKNEGAYHTVMGRGEKSLLCDPGSELLLRKREREEKGEENKWDGEKNTHTHTGCAVVLSLTVHREQG